MAGPCPRARQCGDQCGAGCNLWLAPLSRQLSQSLAGRRQLRADCADGFSKELKAHRLLLDYDDVRSGSFEPLREVPDDKFVVLGLITTKTPRMETRQGLTQRVREASRYVPLEQLALSPQCGFASSGMGNRILLEGEKRKLRLLVETARADWV